MKPVLEILIPTFNRTESAQEAINSVLACNDDRLTVRCNSNGYDPVLEKYRNLNHRVKYDSFESNRGPHANFTKLLLETNANFCMLLSDEDRVNYKDYKNILDYLDNLDETTNLIACSVFDQKKDLFHWKPSSRISESNIHSYVALSPLSTYMTGLIYRVESLNQINITDLMNPTIGNAYGHLDINLHVLLDGKLGYYCDRFVEKGSDIKFGGDGYSHKSLNSSMSISDPQNLDLNPSIYGPRARARQFYYRENLLNELKDSIGFISMCIGKLNYIDFFYKGIMSSDELVILPKNTILKKEALAAYHDSKANKENSGSIASLFFTLLLRFPKFISNPLFFTLSFLNRMIRKAYMLHLSFTQQNYKD